VEEDRRAEETDGELPRLAPLPREPASREREGEPMGATSALVSGGAASGASWKSQPPRAPDSSA
jgi:hypothetical protein